MSYFTSWIAKQVSKLGTQVEVMYQCLSLHKFLFPLSLVYCYRIFCFLLFCFAILFCWWPETSNSSLNFDCKISRQQCFLKRAKPPWNRRATNSFFLSEQMSTKHFAFWPGDTRKVQFTCTHFNAIYCMLLEYSVQIGIVLHNHPFSKRFTVEVKEVKMTMTRRERLRFNT